MSPSRSRSILIVSTFGLIALSLWLLNREVVVEELAEPPLLHARAAVPAEVAVSEEGLAASSSGADINRETIDPQKAFIARWRALYADPEIRQRVRGPRMKRLEELRRTHQPLPFEKELEHLAEAGVVPPPPKQTFEDLLLEEMDTARSMMENQVQYLRLYPAAEVQRWRDREADSVKSQPLDYAPESLAAFLIGRDVTADGSWTNMLVARLAAIRASALRTYAQAWNEYQYVGHLCFNASLDTDFQLPPGSRIEEAAKLIPEVRAVIDRVNASHADYLREVIEALRAAFPAEAF